MKYLHKFNGNSDFQDYIYGGNYEEPFVSYYARNNVDYNQYHLRGFDFVDLGLPSGILWATCNVFADTPTEPGYYFAWGDTISRSIFSWDNYLFGDQNSLTKYTYNDGMYQLEEVDDMAHSANGGGWRMPTVFDYYELLDNCTMQGTTIDGVKGVRLTSNINSKTIFFPAAGYMNGRNLYANNSEMLTWSATLDDETHAFMFKWNEESSGIQGWARYYGLPIRPVAGDKYYNESAYGSGGGDGPIK